VFDLVQSSRPTPYKVRIGGKSIPAEGWRKAIAAMAADSALATARTAGYNPLNMNGELIAGMLLVLVVLVIMTVLVFVSRARVEKVHREGPPSPRARSRAARRG
jgi:hypothetical protein